LPGSFCYAELGTVVKDSGADYTYLHVTYGSIISYIYSWVNCLLVKPAGLATVMLTCSQYISVMLFDDGCGDAPELIKKLIAIGLICMYL
jgi:L-type amino acid transporter 9